jgi:hypothetical protein
LREFLTQALKQTAIYAVLFLRRFIAALDLSGALRYNGKQNIFIETENETNGLCKNRQKVERLLGEQQVPPF